MLASIRKLFARKPAAPRKPRRELLDDLESAAKSRGLPPPDPEAIANHRMTPRDLEAAAEAIRAADSADLAADADAPEPTAAQLNGEGPKVVRNEGEVYQAAYADARASGASHLAAHEDALYAVRSFNAGNLALRPLPPKPSVATKPASITVQAGYRPTAKTSSGQTQAPKPATASQTPTDATPNKKDNVPHSYSNPGDSKSATITFKDAQGNTHHRKRYWSEEERLAFEPPIPKPYPTAIWGSVKWAEELFAFFDGLTAQAKQRLHHKFPDWNADAQLAESILAAEKRRLEVVASAKGRKYNPVP